MLNFINVANLSKIIIGKIRICTKGASMLVMRPKNEIAQLSIQIYIFKEIPIIIKCGRK